MTQEFVTLPREVVTQALDALEGCRVEYDYHGNPVDASDQDVINASTVLRAALEQPQIQSGGIPPGWRLVPVEPTQAQLNAWQSHFGLIEGAYVAMLAAAPQPPAVKDSLTAQQPQGVRETAPNGATHIQPQQGAFYKRVDEKWYVWSRMEDGRPRRWYISPGTVESCLKPISAATEQPQNHVPDVGNMVQSGWKLVPVEPTVEMLRAGCGSESPAMFRESLRRETDGQKTVEMVEKIIQRNLNSYRAMLAAAPQPQVEQEICCKIWSVNRIDDLGKIVDSSGRLIATVYGSQADKIVACHNSYTQQRHEREPLTDEEIDACF